MNQNLMFMIGFCTLSGVVVLYIFVICFKRNKAEEEKKQKLQNMFFKRRPKIVPLNEDIESNDEEMKDETRQAEIVISNN